MILAAKGGQSVVGEGAFPCHCSSWLLRLAGAMPSCTEEDQALTCRPRDRRQQQAG